MIYTSKILKEKIAESVKEFNLTEAIVNDEVDLIFGEENIELLEEIAHIRGKDNMQIIIRNFVQDVTDSHWFSMKFIPSRKIKGDSHGGRKGIPITFNKLTKQEGTNIIEYPSEWKVMLGSSNESKAKQLQDEFNKREIAFIDAVVKELGIIILEYWELDPNVPDQNKRLEEIRNYVESKYIK